MLQSLCDGFARNLIDQLMTGLHNNGHNIL